MADNLDIISNLKTIGLSDAEARINMTVLGKGVCSMMFLSKQLSIPRTNIYRICQKLVEGKFLEFVVEPQGIRVSAVPPHHLSILLKEKKVQLEAMEKAISTIEKITRKLPPLLQTQVRYYRGIEGMRQLVWNTLKAHNNMYGYSTYERNLLTGNHFEDEFCNEMIRSGFRDHVIVNIKGLNNTRKYYTLGERYQQVRVVEDKKFYISGDTYIYNNIYAVNFWLNGEIVGVEIENTEMARMQKDLFFSVWKKSKPFKDFF